MSEAVEELLNEKEVKVQNPDTDGAKPKKRRRGKKKKHKSQNRANEEDGSDEIDGTAGNHVESKKRPKLLIRPVDVPKAPKNSTQFIIDDHDECHLYFSFETPNPYGEGSRSEGAEDGSDDAALKDIDYEYQSMQDLDNTAYYLQDFELSYSKVRYEEYMRLPKQDLVLTLENLESRVKELEHKLCERDPGSALEQLQRKLLQLQEENSALREAQQHLRKVLAGEESASGLHDSGSEHLHHSSSEQLNDTSSEHSNDSSDDSFHSSEEEGAIFDDLNDNVPIDESDNEKNSVSNNLLPIVGSSDDEQMDDVDNDTENDSVRELSDSEKKLRNECEREISNVSEREPPNDSEREQRNDSERELPNDSERELLNDSERELLNDSKDNV